jgi:hypothetical protein
MTKYRLVKTRLGRRTTVTYSKKRERIEKALAFWQETERDYPSGATYTIEEYTPR